MKTFDLDGDVNHHGIGTRDWMASGQSCAPLAARGVIVAGFTQMGAGYQIIRRSPTFAHIGVCCGGRPDNWVDGRWQQVEPGNVLIAPQGVPHGSRAASGGGKNRGLVAWVLFDPAFLSGTAGSWNRGQTRLVGPKDYRPLWWALQGLYVETSGGGDGATLAHWIDLTVGITMRLAAEETREGSEQLRQVWESVDADLRHGWSVEEMAERACVSVTHFRRLCVKQMGVSPLRHLTRLRMQRAAAMLVTSDHKLASIGAAVGYENEFAFSVAFKRWGGKSPGEWRKG